MRKLSAQTLTKADRCSELKIDPEDSEVHQNKLMTQDEVEIRLVQGEFSAKLLP